MRYHTTPRSHAEDQHEGFTLIEVLIVVVVIGILSTIAIVGYNGIQLRAENTQMLIAMGEWKKSLELYKAKNGALPATGSSAVCIGRSYPAANGFPENSCEVLTNGTVISAVDSSVNDAIAPYIDNMPATSNVRVQFSGKFNFVARGVRYAYPPGAVEGVLSYQVRGDQSCGSYSKVYYPTYGPGGITLCSVKIAVDNP